MEPAPPGRRGAIWPCSSASAAQRLAPASIADDPDAQRVAERRRPARRSPGNFSRKAAFTSASVAASARRRSGGQGVEQRAPSEACARELRDRSPRRQRETRQRPDAACIGRSCHCVPRPAASHPYASAALPDRAGDRRDRITADGRARRDIPSLRLSADQGLPERPIGRLVAEMAQTGREVLEEELETADQQAHASHDRVAEGGPEADHEEQDAEL